MPAAGPRTSGMLALVPRADARDAMAVEGGDPPDQLHMTLAYLGDDVTGLAPEQVEGLRRIAATLARREPVMTDAMGHATFNPSGGPDGQRRPAAVHLFNGADLGSIRDAAVYGIARMLGGDAPEQHEPHLPHVTAGYGLDQSALTHTGPVTFDAVRLALGDQVEDFPMDHDPDADLAVDGIDAPRDPMAEVKDVVATQAGVDRYGKDIGEEIGEARDAAAQEARNDPDSVQLYREFIGDDPKTMAKGLDGLGDDELQRLTRVAYSGKSRDPKVVALRLAVASEMASRDMDVKDYGAQGGGIKNGKKPIPGTGGTPGGRNSDLPAGWADALERERGTGGSGKDNGKSKGKGKGGKKKGKGDEDDPTKSPEAERGRQAGRALYAREGKSMIELDATGWDEGTLLGLAGLPVPERKESGSFKPGQTHPSANPGATKLREYWVHGKGAAKIKWGVPGDFKRCVRQMREHVGTRAEGLCNVYHRSALGVAPGQEGKAIAPNPTGGSIPTLFVDNGRGGMVMRVVGMLGGSETTTRTGPDREAKALAQAALAELGGLLVEERFDDALDAADLDRKALVRALDPQRTPWQAHASATGDAYVAGMMLGVYGRDADDATAREAKAAGVPVVEVKDVSTAAGGTQTSSGFGTVQRGDPNAEQADRLRAHFTQDRAGLAKWRPDQPGRFKRLVRALRKVAGSGAEGLGAVYYRDVMGEWPGRRARRRAAAGTKSLAPGADWDAFAAPELSPVLVTISAEEIAAAIEGKAMPPALAKAKRKPGAKGDPEDEQAPKRDQAEEPEGAGAPPAARKGPARPPQRGDGPPPPGRGAPPDARADDRGPVAGRPAPRDTPPGGANKPGREVVIDPETGEEMEPAQAQDAPGGGEPQRNPGTANREAEPVGDTGAETDRDGEEIAPEVAAYPEVDTDVDIDEDYEDALANTVDYMITPEGLIVPDTDHSDPVDRNAQGQPIDAQGNVIDEPEGGEDGEDPDGLGDDEGDDPGQGDEDDPDGLQPPEDEADEDPEDPEDDDSLEPPDGVDETDDPQDPPDDLDESDPDAYGDGADDEDDEDQDEPPRRGRPAPGKPGVPAKPGKARKPGKAVNAPPFGKGRARR